MRKNILEISLFILCGIILTSSCNEYRLKKKAAEIHERILTIDTHTDTPFWLLLPEFDIGERHNSRNCEGKVDFPRMKEGGLDAVFLGVFVGQGDRNPEANKKALQKAIKEFESIHNAIKKHSDVAELAYTPDDAYRIKKDGKRAVYIGMENGYPVGNDLSLIKKFYDLGARYITLCHGSNNDICSSSTDTTEDTGLTEFGKEVVREMNRLGMLIDVSHMSDKSLYDVLECSGAPVFASHSCAKAICDHPRNLSDEMIKKLAEKGGVIQICILSSFLKKSEPNKLRDSMRALLRKKYEDFIDMPDVEKRKMLKEQCEINKKYPVKMARVSDVVDHIDHVVKLVGVDYVGIGTDFDGGGGVENCYDVSEMKNITMELLRRGYTEKDIEKIWGGNFMRVFRKAQQSAKNKQQPK
ncbi:MAG: dipeptidase [Bacteroidales bacterium]|nr:dipeptidase [Bacteroidales bacterium]